MGNQIGITGFPPADPLPRLLAFNTKVLSGTGTVVVPIFRVDGVAKITKLWGIVGVVLGNHTNAHFRINDATITVPVSKTTTATFTGYVSGSPFYRAGLAADALLGANASTCAVIDPTAKSEFLSTELVLVKKNGVTTNLEYVFDTTDPATTGTISFYAEYQSRFGSSMLVAI